MKTISSFLLVERHKSIADDMRHRPTVFHGKAGMVQQPEGTDITMMVMSMPQSPAALLAPPLASLLQQRIDSTHNYNINIATTSTTNQSNDCLLRLLDGYDSGAMRNANFTTFNNLGVFFLRDRKYFEAIHSFMEAAKFVVGDDRFTVRAAPTFQAFYLLLDDFRTRVNGCGFADKGHVDTPPKFDEMSEDALRHESTYAFQYPIVLSTDATGPEAGNLAAEATIQLSLITLYNMGLAFHRAALDLNSLHILQQALVHYEIAYRILISDPRVLVSQAMVILNNIGHIHRLMHNEDRARACFQYLLTTMIYVQQRGDSQQIPHWESFFSNVVDLIAPAPRPAPAA